jgi:hypothetical protein
MLAEVTADTAKSIKAEFLTEFGKLADLSTDKQQEARDWVALKIAMADLADAEWIASATDKVEEGQ